VSRINVTIKTASPHKATSQRRRRDPRPNSAEPPRLGAAVGVGGIGGGTSASFLMTIEFYRHRGAFRETKEVVTGASRR
jgi:hypothetical protein